MEKEANNTIVTKKRKWGGYIIAFVIFATYKNTKIDEAHLFTGLVWLVSIFLIPWLYYRVKTKVVFIKNETIKNIVVGISLVLVAIFFIPFFGTLGDRLILKTPSDQTLKERDAIIQANNDAKTWFVEWQKRWDSAEAEIINDTSSPAQYSKNISAYKKLQILNVEKYTKTKELFDVVAKYLPLFSNYDLSNVYKVSVKLRDSYDALFVARIDYFQGFLDRKSTTEMNNRRQLINERVDQVTAVENEAQTVLAEYNKALTEIPSK